MGSTQEIIVIHLFCPTSVRAHAQAHPFHLTLAGNLVLSPPPPGAARGGQYLGCHLREVALTQ